MNAFSRRGACPALSAPMQTGDGLLVRLNPLAAGLSPGTLTGLCKAALRHGNGVVEVTGRGSLQIRGLTPRSAVLLAGEVGRLGIRVRTGLPVEHGSLAGLDPEETADPRPVAGRIQDAAAKAGLERRLGPKVSAVVDGGGRSGLSDVTADVRLTASLHAGRILWTLAVGGDARTARPVATLPDASAARGALAILDAVAALGPGGRARDLDPGELSSLTAEVSEEIPPPLTPPHKGEGEGAFTALVKVLGQSSSRDDARGSPPPCGEGQGWGYEAGTSNVSAALCADGRMLVSSLFPLRDGRSALAVAMPFGQVEAEKLIALMAGAEAAGVAEIRLAPRRTLLSLCPTADAAERLRSEAARLGFLVDAADPRAGIAACPGAPACASGRIPARELAARIAEAHGDILDGSIDIHVSGCAKGCASPGKAALTLVGCDAAAGLLTDATARDSPIAAVPAAQALGAFGRAATLLRVERRPGETTAACASRLGGRLAEAFEKG